MSQKNQMHFVVGAVDQKSVQKLSTLTSPKFQSTKKLTEQYYNQKPTNC